jgi:hypothetical protein
MFQLVVAVIAGTFLALPMPASAQISDPFQSNPGPAAAAAPVARPNPAPRAHAPIEREPAFEQPLPAVAPVPVAPVRQSLVGTWRGQAWQWPVVMVIQRDDGLSVSLQLIGSQIVAGRAVETGVTAHTVQRRGDGSFTIEQPASGNLVENVRPCGADICATYYRRESDARAPVVFKRSQ